MLFLDFLFGDRGVPSSENDGPAGVAPEIKTVRTVKLFPRWIGCFG
jgi:hypothetical protein